MLYQKIDNRLVSLQLLDRMPASQTSLLKHIVYGYLMLNPGEKASKYQVLQIITIQNQTKKILEDLEKKGYCVCESRELPSGRIRRDWKRTNKKLKF